MTNDPLTELALARAAKELARRDRHLAALFAKHGPPPLWSRPQCFSTLIKIILEQQVSLASAPSVFARLRKNVVPFRPVRMIELGEVHLKSLGLTRQKTTYCLHLAESLADKRLRLSQLSSMDDEQAKATLMEIKGLGAWSADIYLLMALRRPDIWPVNDLAIAVAVAKLRELKAKPNPIELTALAEAWRPYRSVAARMLWQYYLARSSGNGK